MLWTLERAGENSMQALAQSFYAQWIVWVLSSPMGTCCQFVASNLLSCQQPGFGGCPWDLFWLTTQLSETQSWYWKLCLVIRDDQLGFNLPLCLKTSVELTSNITGGQAMFCNRFNIFVGDLSFKDAVSRKKPFLPGYSWVYHIVFHSSHYYLEMLVPVACCAHFSFYYLTPLSFLLVYLKICWLNFSKCQFLLSFFLFY